MSTDLTYLRAAIIEAHAAEANGEVPVGAIVAHKNSRLEDCILYATLEPCAMCAGAIIHARISRLVYAAPDPKAGACGSVLSVMNHPQLNHKVEIVSGLLAKECGSLLTNFFIKRR